MPTPGLLGIGSNNNNMVFHRIEVLDISGKGQAVEAQSKRMPEPAAASAKQPPKNNEVEGAF